MNTTKKIVIRKAKKTDLEDIFSLVWQLARYEKGENEVKSTINDYVEAFEEELMDAHVATADGVVVGMALYYMTFSTWKGKMLYLEDFIVDENFRRLNIGQQLFDAFIQEAKSRNCNLVKWQVLDWNTPAINFYKRNNSIFDSQWIDCKIIF